MEQRFGYSLEELARRFDRSVSWVSRRLALVELLPEAIQQQVREGKIAAQVAMKYLVPVARAKPGGLPADGRRFRSSIGAIRGKPANCMRAWREGSRRGSRAHSGRAGAVFENAAAAQPAAASRRRRPNCERDLEMAAAIVHRAAPAAGRSAARR